MKVIIVGGGIAGLSLANALEKASIDFTLLERRSIFDPQVGASIGLGPNSMRILDQVGAAQEILDNTKSVKIGRHRNKDGNLIMPPNKNFPLLEQRFGYGICFLDRQIVLRALFNAIEGKGRLLANKRVQEIEHLEEGVRIRCDDGTTYEGDVVIGCDGVHSKVRSEMWRLASKTDPTYFPQKEQEKMTAEYTCLFGISHPLPGMNEGDVDNMYDKGHSMLVITGKDGRIYWFYFEKLPEPAYFHSNSFPRYSQKDAEDQAEKNGWRPWHDKYTLKDLWNNRITYTLVAMEEALFENWYWGRVATIGDGAHKMTANQGSGGNAAVESVAAMANELKRLQETISSSAPVSSKDVRTAFSAWKAKRKERIQSTCKEAAAFCRLQGLATLGDSITVFYVLPAASDYISAVYTKALIGAEVLEYLPLPERSFKGTALFNPKQGIGHEEKTLMRVLYAAPLLVMAYFAYYHADAPSAFFKAQTDSAFNGSLSDLLTTTSQPSTTPPLISAITTLLTPSSPQTTWLPAYTFHLTTTIIYSIWSIESNRRANALTLVQLAAIFASLANVSRPSLIAPIFYALHYIFSPIENFAPADNRLTDMAYTRTVLPLMLVQCLIPLAMRVCGVSFPMGTEGNGVWWGVLLAPVLVSTMQWLLVKMGVSTSDVEHDSLFNPKRDLSTIRWTVGVLASLSSLTHCFTLYTKFSVQTTTFSGLFFLGREPSSFLGATGLWLLLLFLDLHSAGMFRPGFWMRCIPALVVCDLVLGPCATVALGWLWREEVLASRKHKSALTEERYGGGRTVWEVDRTWPVRRVEGNGDVKMNGHGK